MWRSILGRVRKLSECFTWFLIPVWRQISPNTLVLNANQIILPFDYLNYSKDHGKSTKVMCPEVFFLLFIVWPVLNWNAKSHTLTESESSSHQNLKWFICTLEFSKALTSSRSSWFGLGHVPLPWLEESMMVMLCQSYQTVSNSWIYPDYIQ